jgi:mannosyltransferase OCH1-like enzyme
MRGFAHVSGEKMIPRKIHYCWFGKGQMPKRLADCIKTWELVMPDYQIVQWDESKFDIGSIPFTAEAYGAKKWAFVSEYIRLLALYTEGGIYLDIDVIAVKRFDDFLENDFFSAVDYHPYKIKAGNSLSLLNEDGTLKDGHTSCPHGFGILSPIMGSIPGHVFIKDCMEYYNNRHFILPDGTLDLKPTNDICAEIATKYGFRYKDVLQKLGNNMTFYPSSVLAGEPNGFTKESYALHIYENSWIGGWQKIKALLSKINLLRILLGKKPMITPNTVIKKYKDKKNRE